MPEQQDYSIITQFLEKYAPQGFEHISRQDPFIINLEEHLKQARQFFYIADLMLMKVRFVSKHSETVIGVDPNEFDLSSIITRVHPEDFRKHNLARSIVIKKGYELLVNRIGISVHSTNSRVRNATGSFINHFIQAYNFYDPKGQTVFTLILLTDSSLFKFDKYKYHYYVGSDRAMFRYPDEELLSAGHRFSEREFEIIKWIADGLDSEQIANKLSLSLNTINTHRRNILKKTRKSTIRDLIVELRKKGMLQ